MRNCLKCGNAVGEPGKVYGYAGEWCHCVDPSLDAYPPVAGFPEIRPTPHLDEWIRELRKNPTSGPIVVMPPSEPPTTPSELVHWLRGYATAGGPVDPKILDELRKVKT